MSNLATPYHLLEILHEAENESNWKIANGGIIYFLFQAMCACLNVSTQGDHPRGLRGLRLGIYLPPSVALIFKGTFLMSWTDVQAEKDFNS